MFMPAMWPKQLYLYSKTPTVAIYKDKKMTHWGWDAEVEFPKQKDADFVQRVKLHLMPRVAPVAGAEAFNPSIDSPLPDGVEAVQVIADYLRAMSETVFSEMNRNGVEVQPREVRWCLTVPAIWSYQSKAIMLEAAALAGISRGPANLDGSPYEVQIVPEPEAAALNCLQNLRELNAKIDPHAAYLIADLGGGTADLIMLGFEQAVGKPTRIVELTAGTGDLCGGSMLDNMFFKLLSKLTGLPAWPEFSETMVKPAYQTRGNWAQFKRVFGVISTKADGTTFTYEEYLTQLQGFTLELKPSVVKLLDPVKWPKAKTEQSILIPAADIKFIFDYVITRISHLIDEQITLLRHSAATRDRVFMFLVGGLSESPYIQRVLKHTYEAQGVTIYTPPAAGAAIFRGAVLFGLNPNPSASIVRRARRTFGPILQRNFLVATDPQRLCITKPGQPDKILYLHPMVFKTQLLEPDAWYEVELQRVDPDDTEVVVKLHATDVAKTSGIYPEDSEYLGKVTVKLETTENTIILKMNFSGTVLKACAYPKGNTRKVSETTIKFDAEGKVLPPTPALGATPE